MTTHLQKPSSQKLTKLAQRADLSSHWTIAVGRQSFLVLLCGMGLIQLTLAALLPPVADELYYWNWAQQWQLGYLDHPPMVAWWIKISTAVFGDHTFGIRFFGCLTSFFLMWSLGQLSHDRFCLKLALFTPLVAIGALIMTPDIPLMFFWTCYLLWFRELSRRLSDWEANPVERVYHKSPIPLFHWVLGGGLLGLGLLSKYTMLLAIPCGVLLLLFHYRFQAWVLGYGLHLVAAALTALPILYFNMEHHWSPFLFQWEHAMGNSQFSFSRFWETTGVQALITGALPFLFFPLVLFRTRGHREDAPLQAHYFFFVVPALFFAYKALTSRIEANWPLVTYVAFWTLGQRMIDSSSFRGAVRFIALLCFLPAILCTLLFFIHWQQPLSMVPAKKDRLHRLVAEEKLYEHVQKDFPDRNILTFAPTYQIVSFLRFHGLLSQQIPGHGRPSYFSSQLTQTPCEYNEIYYFGPHTLSPNHASCFSETRTLRTYPLVVRGNTLETLQLIHYWK